MKKSHFTTPRTMDDAVWHPWGAAIEKPAEEPAFGFWDCVLLIVTVIVLATIVFKLVGVL